MLAPSGILLGRAMKAKSACDGALTNLWSAAGLPTKRDQERTLFLLQKVESRLMDLEERLDRAENRTLER